MMRPRMFADVEHSPHPIERHRCEMRQTRFVSEQRLGARHPGIPTSESEYCQTSRESQTAQHLGARLTARESMVQPQGDNPICYNGLLRYCKPSVAPTSYASSSATPVPSLLPRTMAVYAPGSRTRSVALSRGLFGAS